MDTNNENTNSTLANVNTDIMDRSNIATLVANVVSSYVSRNEVAPADLPGLITEVYKSFDGGGVKVEANTPVEKEPLTPAVPIKKSVTDDFIICLNDGKKFKSLKRHLKTHYDLTPEQYRQMWGLPAEYPMVAPNYAAQRSQLAKSIGLGQKRKGTASADAAEAHAEETAHAEEVNQAPKSASKSRKRGAKAKADETKANEAEVEDADNAAPEEAEAVAE